MQYIFFIALCLASTTFAALEEKKKFVLKIDQSNQHPDLAANLDFALTNFAQAFGIKVHDVQFSSSLKGENTYSGSLSINDLKDLKRTVFLTDGKLPEGNFATIEKFINALLKNLLKNSQLSFEQHITRFIDGYMLALTPAFTVTTQPTFNGSREINFVWPTEISDERCKKIEKATIKLGSAIGTKIVKIISCENKSIKLQINSPKEKKIVSTPPLAIFNSDSNNFYEELFFIQSYLTTLLKKLDIDPSNGYFMGYYNVSFWATFTTCFGCTEDPLWPPYSLYFMPLP